MKKIVSACVVAALAACAFGGATLAYFTGEDLAKNVMTTGNVAIEQLEKQRSAEGGWEDFTQKQDLFPMVDNREADAPVKTDDGFFNPAMENVIDKFVSVKNTGSESAYVRTIIAFESGKIYAEGSSTEWTDAHDVYFGINSTGLVFLDPEVRFNIGNTEYVVAVRTYDAALAAGATTDPSLKQFFLAPTAGNEVVDLFGETYDILCLSQAVQSEGFVDGPEAALDAAFGEVTAENCANWFAAIA